MKTRSFVAMFAVVGCVLAGASESDAQTSGSALQQGNALLSEIRGLVSDTSSRVAAVESAQPPQVSVASCLNQVLQTLNQYESSGTAALSSLESSVNAGDSGTATAQLSILILANKNAKVAAASAAACEASGVAAGSVDANGDGVPDGESSSGGLSGLDDFSSEEDVAAGFSSDEYIPAGDSIEEPATNDVVTSPAVTP